MIEGFVNADHEAVITLALRGPAGQEQDIDAVIDTGYTGYLTLPRALVSELGLAFESRGRATLANGSKKAFDIYGVTVLWDSQARYVSTLMTETDGIPLVGMSLLDSYSLYVEIADGGRVVVQAME